MRQHHLTATWRSPRRWANGGFQDTAALRRHDTRAACRSARVRDRALDCRGWPGGAQTSTWAEPNRPALGWVCTISQRDRPAPCFKRGCSIGPLPVDGRRPELSDSSTAAQPTGRMASSQLHGAPMAPRRQRISGNDLSLLAIIVIPGRSGFHVAMKCAPDGTSGEIMLALRRRLSADELAIGLPWSCC